MLEVSRKVILLHARVRPGVFQADNGVISTVPQEALPNFSPLAIFSMLRGTPGEYLYEGYDGRRRCATFLIGPLDLECFRQGTTEGHGIRDMVLMHR